MKPIDKAALIGLGALALLAGGAMFGPAILALVHKPPAAAQDDYADGLQAILKDCTNEVVGIHRIVEIRYSGPWNYKDGSAVTNRITLDYVNHFGGMDRTNLPFICRRGTYTNTENEVKTFPWVYLDAGSIYRERMGR